MTIVLGLRKGTAADGGDVIRLDGSRPSVMLNNSFPPVVRSYGGLAVMIMESIPGTELAPAACVTGSFMGGLNMKGSKNSAGAAGSAGQIRAVATENWNATSTGGRIEILTTPNGTASSQVRMCLDPDGTVRIGPNIGSRLAFSNTGDINILNGLFANVFSIESDTGDVVSQGGITAAGALTSLANTAVGTSLTVGSTIVAAGSATVNSVIVSTVGAAPTNFFQRRNGSLAFPSAVTSGMQLGSTVFQGTFDGTGALNTGGSIRMLADSLWTAANSAARIELVTVPTGSTVQVVRGGVGQGGVLYLGTTEAGALFKADQNGDVNVNKIIAVTSINAGGNLIGSAAASGSLFIDSTSHATKGLVTVGSRLVVGGAAGSIVAADASVGNEIFRMESTSATLNLDPKTQYYQFGTITPGNANTDTGLIPYVAGSVMTIETLVQCHRTTTSEVGGVWKMIATYKDNGSGSPVLFGTVTTVHTAVSSTQTAAFQISGSNIGIRVVGIAAQPHAWVIRSAVTVVDD